MSSDLVAQHKAAKKRLKILRIAGPLVLVLVIVLGLWGIVDVLQSIDREKLLSEGEKQFQERVLPDLQKQLADLGTRLRPMIQENFERLGTEKGPEIKRRIDTQLELLRKDAEKEMDGTLKATENATREKRRELLVKAFPEIAKDRTAQNRILAAAQTATQEWAKRKLTSELNAHIVAMARIRDTLNRSFRTKGGVRAAPEKAAMIWLELAADSMGGDDAILTDKGLEKPAAGAAKKPGLDKKKPVAPKKKADGDKGGAK